MASPSLGRDESCESMYAHGSAMHEKCSNYALTNFLFGLCKLISIIKSFVTCFNPPSPRRPLIGRRDLHKFSLANFENKFKKRSYGWLLESMMFCLCWRKDTHDLEWSFGKEVLDRGENSVTHKSNFLFLKFNI